MTATALALRLPSTTDLEAFRKDGFVKLRGFLNAREVAQLRKAMDDALATFGTSPNAYDVTATADLLWKPKQTVETDPSKQHDLERLAGAVRNSGLPRLLEKAESVQKKGRFLVDTSVWRRTPRLADFILGGPLGAAAAELLGANEIRFFDDQLFVKEAGALDKAAFHQDISYFHLDGARGCVAWIPLDPVRRGFGAMGYVPGSHRWPGVYNPNIFASRMAFPGSSGPDLPDIEANPDQYNVAYVEADPGDVIVHHFLTVHGSEGNTSQNTRRAFSLRFCDSTIRYRHRAGAPPQPLHVEGVYDGEPLDNAVHPVVFHQKL